MPCIRSHFRSKVWGGGPAICVCKAPFPAMILMQVLRNAKPQSFFFFLLFRVAPTAYESSQVRSPIGATAAFLCHSHSNAGSEPNLRPIPQVTTMLDP